MQKQKTRDLIIIGSGPAGLTAAIYAARADLRPLVIAGQEFGGQLMQTTEVENYPGFPEGIMGPQLIKNMIKQAQRFGTEFIYQNSTSVNFNSNISKSTSEDLHKIFIGEEEYQAKSVIIASGARPRKLNVEGESEFWGKGVSSCATCDGAFYRDKTVAVVGGGDSAMEESTFLTKFAKKVYVIHRRDELRASKIMQDRAKSNEKIEIIYNTVIDEISGEHTVRKLRLSNIKSGESSNLEVDGLFLAIGYIPETELFGEYVDLKENGYAKPAKPGSTATKTAGVFVAGDVEDDHYRQAITAAADGCKAALDVEHYLETLQ